MLKGLPFSYNDYKKDCVVTFFKNIFSKLSNKKPWLISFKLLLKVPWKLSSNFWIKQFSSHYQVKVLVTMVNGYFPRPLESFCCCTRAPVVTLHYSAMKSFPTESWHSPRQSPPGPGLEVKFNQYYKQSDDGSERCEPRGVSVTAGAIRLAWCQQDDRWVTLWPPWRQNVSQAQTTRHWFK